MQKCWSDLQLEFDLAGAVVSHKAFECVPERDARMQDVVIEGSPFICYGLLDSKVCHLGFSAGTLMIIVSTLSESLRISLCQP